MKEEITNKKEVLVYIPVPGLNEYIQSIRCTELRGPKPEVEIAINALVRNLRYTKTEAKAEVEAVIRENPQLTSAEEIVKEVFQSARRSDVR